jgi:hypothetical protein
MFKSSAISENADDRLQYHPADDADLIIDAGFQLICLNFGPLPLINSVVCCYSVLILYSPPNSYVIFILLL